MDRISALRNVEDALAAFEDGDLDLGALEREVRGVLRTYATDFEGELSAYRASGADGADRPADGSGRRVRGGGGDGQNVDGIVVLASSRQTARERVRDLVDEPGEFTVERYEGER